ncbi:MAG: hypothetical protein ROO76_19380 [Terriglobia bacterium]|jgi:hypothetical protein|nr:hypothetical protein [Terriglobia bacterium]
MKMLWCWRCKAEMPMLDEEEYSQVTARKGSGLRERFQPMLEEYERMTGFHEANPMAIFHHRISLYGPPCAHCGKPLRTPTAKVCGACMRPVAT